MENWFRGSNNVTKLLSSIGSHANRLAIVLFVLDYSNETLCADDRILELFSRRCNEDQLISAFQLIFHLHGNSITNCWNCFTRSLCWWQFFTLFSLRRKQFRLHIRKYFINKYEVFHQSNKCHWFESSIFRTVLCAAVFVFGFEGKSSFKTAPTFIRIFNCSSIYHFFDDVTVCQCLISFCSWWKRRACEFSCVLRLN